MQFAKLSFLFVIYFQMCSGRNDTFCAKSKPCDCRVIGSSKISINCSGMGLKISTVCGICVKIRHVERLDVGNNNLSNIPRGCFEQCMELEELHLDSNNLKDLKNDAFLGLVSLKRLSMNNNSLVRGGEIYDPELFKHVSLLEELQLQKNIKTIKLGNNYMSNAENNTLVNLRVLYLDGLPRGRFGANFINFKYLVNISLSGAPIFDITYDTFKNIPNVQALDMSYCNLSRIDAESFEPLKVLKFLNLSNNIGLGFPTLRNISYGLRDSRSIESFDYSRIYKTFGLTTQLNRCDVWYLQNTTLKELYINSNRMSSVELDALRLMPTTLETFFVEDNFLTFGPYALQAGCMANLKRLELSRQQSVHRQKNFNDEMDINENELDTSGGCQLDRQTLKPGCWSDKHKPLESFNFHFPSNLKHIGFSQSNIRYEPSEIPLPLPLKNSIETADLSYNLIYKWNDPIVIFNDLKLLNLSHNFCTNITGDFFRNCSNLETFDASYNKIGQRLGNDINGLIFARVTGLKILDISACWIAELPQRAFIYLRSLEHLDLSYNMLETVEFQFQHMVNLTTLSLRQNKISALPLNLLEQMKHSGERLGKNISIDLSENSLEAENCKNMQFLSWIIQHPTHFSNIESYKFYTADHNQMSYQKLKSRFSYIKKGCQTYTGLIVLASMFIKCTASVIMSGIIYRYRWRLRYFYYMTKAKHRGYVPIRNTDTGTTFEYDVFISYSTDDYQFVTGEMYNRLKEAGLSMCLHQKDFLPGHDIAGNILQAIRNSRITLVVLSPAFLESKWCIYEFNMARMEGIYSREGENVIYAVLYQPIDITGVSPEMRECFESESYSQYPDTEDERPYFWQMLVRALGEHIVQPVN